MTKSQSIGTSSTRNSRLPLGLPTDEDAQAAKSWSVGTSGGSQNFQHSELPTLLGTSDERRFIGGLRLSQQAPGLPTPNVGTSDYQKSTNYVQVSVWWFCVSLLILLLCFSTLSSSDHLNLHPSYSTAYLNPKQNKKALDSALGSFAFCTWRIEGYHFILDELF